MKYKKAEQAANPNRFTYLEQVDTEVERLKALTGYEWSWEPTGGGHDAFIHWHTQETYWMVTHDATAPTTADEWQEITLGFYSPDDADGTLSDDVDTLADLVAYFTDIAKLELAQWIIDTEGFEGFIVQETEWNHGEWLNVARFTDLRDAQIFAIRHYHTQKGEADSCRCEGCEETRPLDPATFRVCVLDTTTKTRTEEF
jgi:hypothetical protein